MREPTRMGELRRRAVDAAAGVVLAGVVGSGLSACSPPPPAEDPVSSVRAFITGYSYFDNTPPGSAQVSHPVRHDVAGGLGTYDDPITVAVGHERDGGDDILDWPAGTRFYVPNLRRYLIVEDTCGDGERPQDGPCHTGYPPEASTWLDVWVGGQGGSEFGVRACMDAITGVWDVIVDPEPGYVVVAGDIYAADAAGAGSYGEPLGCTERYGDELVRAS